MKAPAYSFLLLYLLLIPLQVGASGLDDLLLRTQATIYPKVVLLDKDVESKISGNEVAITVVYQPSDRKSAEQFKRHIDEKYRGTLGGRMLTVAVSSYDEMSTDSPATAYVLMPASRAMQKRITRYASSNHRICFSYNYKDFESDALVSLLMKEKMYIYLNKQAINGYGVRFLPSFYKIVKVIE